VAKKRKQCTGDEKLAILRQHHLEGVPMSDICGEHELQLMVFYPQRSGKIERWHRSLKSECIRPTAPLLLPDGPRAVRKYTEVYNAERLHSASGYITPQDKLAGGEAIILAERTPKLAEAREARACLRQSVHSEGLPGHPLDGLEMGAAYTA